MKEMELYLHPTYFIESGHPAVVAQAKALTEPVSGMADKAAALFYWVRDTFSYYPYEIDFRPPSLRAGYLMEREGPRRGYCLEKSIVFAALCRAAGIPNRLLFANVRNHIGVERLVRFLGTDLLVFHGYNEVWVGDRWIKCTVAFNRELCEKLGVHTLEFDGASDCVFQEYDREGGRFMTYEHDYGAFHDFPHDLWLRETRAHYPHFFEGEEVFRLPDMTKAPAGKHAVNK